VAIEHGRAVMRGVLAQEIHHRVKNNLQTVASLLRLHANAENVDAQQVLADSVNRILAIAAVHEVLTKRQDDDVELADLIERLRITIVQGLGSPKSVSTQLEPVSLPGNQATALALVFTELLQNAIEHGGDAITIELSQSEGAVHLTVADNGPGISGEGKGIGLEIVRALVKDELFGKLELRNESGLRAELSFPL
jgi:two-component sensor histidine kinase